jgi:glutaminase
MSHTAYRETAGSIASAVAIDEITGADPNRFGVSVCTVDGQVRVSRSLFVLCTLCNNVIPASQIANLGDSDAEFPMMAAIRPLLYGLACKVRKTRAAKYDCS